MIPCAPASPSLGFIQDLLDQADCHAGALASGGYERLTANGSLVPALVGGMLTLFVATRAWHLLQGGTLSFGQGSASLLRIGFVLALITQWPLYKSLVYEVLTESPIEVGNLMLADYVEMGAAPDPLVQLQRAFDRLMDAAAASTGPPSVPSGEARTTEPAQPPRPSGFELRAAAAMLFMSTAGLLVAGKLLLAILLGVGPLLLLLMLFRQTNGITVGWLRAALSVSLAMLVARISLVVEVRILAPVLAQLAPARLPAAIDPKVASSAMLITGIFVAVTLGGILLSVLIANGLRLPTGRIRAVASDGAALRPVSAAPLSQPVTRAQRIVAVQPMQRHRDERAEGAVTGSAVHKLLVARSLQATAMQHVQSQTLGARRRLRAPRSAAMDRRDQ